MANETWDIRLSQDGKTWLVFRPVKDAMEIIFTGEYQDAQIVCRAKNRETAPTP